MLHICPTNLKAANSFIRLHHRHLTHVRGCIACVAAVQQAHLVGVAIIGRPSARLLDDGFTAEITRCCTDGTRNACSHLYGACSRIARELGYTHIITYTLASEPGTSLRAAGFTGVAAATGGTWTNRTTSSRNQREHKVRWTRQLQRASTSKETAMSIDIKNWTDGYHYGRTRRHAHTITLVDSHPHRDGRIWTVDTEDEDGAISRYTVQTSEDMSEAWPVEDPS